MASSYRPGYRNVVHDVGGGIVCQNHPAEDMDVDIFNNIVFDIPFHASNAAGSGIDVFNGGRARVYNNIVARANYGLNIGPNTVNNQPVTFLSTAVPTCASYCPTLI
ncbi:MAG: hypothetical protein R3C68_12685 [Myxococcota bacterium]